MPRRRLLNGKPIVAFLATGAVALAGAANQPDPAAPIGGEVSAGWTGICQHRS